MKNRPHTVFKHLKRSNTYVNSTGSLWFSPSEMRAVSYRWWPFLMRIGGKIVFQGGRYSATTQKHQSKVRAWLNSEGVDYIAIDALRAPLNQPFQVLNALRYSADKLLMEAKRKGTRKSKNVERIVQANRFLAQEKLLRRLYRKEGLIA